MRKEKILIAFILCFFAFNQAYGQVNLKALTLPVSKRVEVGFNKTDRAPGRASMLAAINYEKGIATIELNFQQMEPAILFAGDISTYVLWAAGPDGTIDNLGEIIVDKKGCSGSQKFYVNRKILALMVTAEPYSSVRRPTNLILFTSGESREKGVQIAPFTYNDFSDNARPALDSIAAFQFISNVPVALKQAEKTLEFAKKVGADQINPEAINKANEALNKAKKQKDKKMAADGARIATQFAVQAINETIKMQEEKAAAEAEAKSLAEKAALQQRASQAESEAQQLARQLEEIKAERAALAKETEQLASERDQLARERETIQKERDELAGKLKTALSTVAETTDTARGLMVNLAGVLFDVNKATLKPESQLKLAKLAGILMVFPDIKLSIEGHTDATGPEDLNFKLSTDRARTVYEFLMSQGVSIDRMRYQGFGSSRPVAPNDNEMNRAKNRRVEVVVLKETET
ncbi:MAG: OmpA family protein [Acidobacteriota bacterium]|nr:OmpA family protein [Acidobacteriota bacterium]